MSIRALLHSFAFTTTVCWACGPWQTASAAPEANTSANAQCDAADQAAVKNAALGVQSATLALSSDQDTLNREENLFSYGATSDAELMTAQLWVAQTQTQLKYDEARVAELQAKCRADACGVARAQLDEATTSVESAQTQLDYDTVLAKAAAEGCSDGTTSPPTCSTNNITVESDTIALQMAQNNMEAFRGTLCAEDARTATPPAAPAANAVPVVQATFVTPPNTLRVPPELLALIGESANDGGPDPSYCVLSTASASLVTGRVSYHVHCEGSTTTVDGTALYVTESGLPDYVFVTQACAAAQVVSAECDVTTATYLTSGR